MKREIENSKKEEEKDFKKFKEMDEWELVEALSDACEKGNIDVVKTLLENDVDGDSYLACNDCDDLDPLTNPGAAEVCDGVDNDCDGVLFSDVSGDESDADADGSYSYAIDDANPLP